jgi:hypothetical protein
MENASNFPDLINRIKELSERLAQSKTTEEKLALLQEFRAVLAEGDELIKKSG